MILRALRNRIRGVGLLRSDCVPSASHLAVKVDRPLLSWVKNIVLVGLVPELGCDSLGRDLMRALLRLAYLHHIRTLFFLHDVDVD